jgi:hypothetical protein
VNRVIRANEAPHGTAKLLPRPALVKACKCFPMHRFRAPRWRDVLPVAEARPGPATDRCRDGLLRYF